MAGPARSHGRLLYFNLATQGGTPKDLSADTMEVTGIPGEVEQGDVTTGGSTGHRYYPGLQKASASVKMVVNSAADGSFDVIKDYQSDTTPRAFIFCPQGNTSTYIKYTGSAWIKSIDFPAKTTDVNIMTLHLEIDNGVTIGTVT